MFAGHVGAGLAIGAAERRLNVAAFLFAAMALDALLWLFILLGWESARVPVDFPQHHQVAFTFPYSHGFVAGIGWSVAAYALVRALVRSARGARWAAFAAAAVFSHWILDFLVHRPEMPVVGGHSPMLGLALWDHMAVALGVEALVLAAGLWIYLHRARLSRARAIAAIAVALVVLASTIGGMAVAPPPPSIAAMAGTSLVAIAVVCALFAWIDRTSYAPRS